MRLPQSLRAQVTLGSCLLVTVVVAIAGLAIALRIDHQDRAQVDEQLRARAGKVTAESGQVLRQDPGPAGAAKAGDDSDLLAGTEALTRIISGDEVVAELGEGITGPIPLPTELGFSTVTIDGERWRSLVESAEGVPDGRVQILQSLAPLEDRLADNRRLIAIVTVLAMAISAFGAWFVSGLVLRPVGRLRDGANAIRPGDTHQRLPHVEHPLEIADLSETLNAMLERLQRSMDATRRFTADAGHELRTPLTGLGTDLETLRRNPSLPVENRTEMLAAMEREHGRIVELLEGLQQLARGDAEALPERRSIDPTVVAVQAVEAARRNFPSTAFELDNEVTSAGVDGWQEGLRLALDNLLENAAIHGRRNGCVRLRLLGANGDLRIIVEDDGPGIPKAARESVKQRFARGPNAPSNGFGLGLALVDQQARLFGGSLTLATAAAGGLRATLSLPLSSQEDGIEARNGAAEDPLSDVAGM